MKLTSQMIKDRAAELGIDCIAIGNIERFKDAPTLMSPITYFPDAKSVIAVAMRIPRGSNRGIEEGTHWHNYTFYSYAKLNSLFRPRKSYELCRFIEDFGWEAVAHYPDVPEINGTILKPVGPGRVPPQVICSVRVIAAGTGIGEIGWSKAFLTKKFGPRVRLGLIFTDCELEPDPIVETGSICLHCGACTRACPGNAIPDPKIKDQFRVEIDYGETKTYYGDVHMGRCTLTHHGMNRMVSPFLQKDFPNLDFDIRNTQMSEEEAYMMCGAMAKGTCYRKPYDKNIMEFNAYVRNHTGYYAVCGARGCIRACNDILEKTKRIENLFHNPYYKHPSWEFPTKPEKEFDGINPFREAFLDEKYPGIRKNEYKKGK